MSSVPANRPRKVAALSPAQIRALADGLSEGPAGAGTRPRLERSGTQELKLSFVQEGLWFLERSGLVGHAYTLSTAAYLSGDLDVALLEACLLQLVHRHEALRTRFEQKQGEGRPVIDAAGDFQLQRFDVSGDSLEQARNRALELRDRETRRPFDLEHGPLFRVTLMKLAAGEHLLLIAIHHLICDGVSLAILLRELSELYGTCVRGESSTLDALPIRYTDYALWQRQCLQGDTLETHLTYWRERLAGAVQVLELPTDRPRPAVASFKGASAPVTIASSVCEGLRKLGRSEDATLFMVLLAGFQWLLSCLSGQREIVVGTPVAGRTHPTLDGVIGFFVNTVVIRTTMSEDLSFRQVLRLARESALGAYAHQDLPIEKLIGDLRPRRDLSRQPLYQAVLALQNTSQTQLRLPDVELTVLPERETTSKFDLSLLLNESGETVQGHLEYATDLFEAATIERWLGHFNHLLEQVVADPDRPLSELDLPVIRDDQKAPVTLQSPPVDRANRSDDISSRTPAEAVLATIWSEVLQREAVSIHDNFFELGGDSIIALRVVACAQEAGLLLKPRHFFEYKTLRELAAVAEPITAQPQDDHPVTGPTPLTPIQHFFFEQDLSEPDYFNQSVLLQPVGCIDVEALDRAMTAMVRHHEVLRSRFERMNGQWRQECGVTPMRNTYLARLDLTTVLPGDQPAALLQAYAQAQAGMRLEEGRLFGALWCELGHSQRLLLVSHHLVVDGISWRVLMEDLAVAYEQTSAGKDVVLGGKRSSFKRWADSLESYASSPALAQQIPYWLRLAQAVKPVIPLDHQLGPNDEASTEAVTVRLDAHDTRSLLSEIPAAYRTEINDVLLAALAQTLTQWSSESNVLVGLEGHGREEIVSALDLSRSVGWHTSLFPLLLRPHETGTSPGDVLKAIKEQVRQVPDRGIGYGVLRYLGADSSLRDELATIRPPVNFNYFGQVAHPPGRLFELLPESAGPERSETAPRFQLIEFSCVVVGGVLQLNCGYSRNFHRRATIETLCGRFMQHLRGLIRHCLEPDAGGLTPSDFPLAGLDQRKLDKLYERTRARFAGSERLPARESI